MTFVVLSPSQPANERLGHDEEGSNARGGSSPDSIWLDVLSCAPLPSDTPASDIEQDLLLCRLI